MKGLSIGRERLWTNENIATKLIYHRKPIRKRWLLHTNFPLVRSVSSLSQKKTFYTSSNIIHGNRHFILTRINKADYARLKDPWTSSAQLFWHTSPNCPHTHRPARMRPKKVKQLLAEKSFYGGDIRYLTPSFFSRTIHASSVPENTQTHEQIRMTVNCTDYHTLKTGNSVRI